MVLLNLGDDLGHFSPLGEVDQLGVVEEVRVALLQEEDVGLVLAEEGDARGVEGPKPLPVDLEVVRNEGGSFFQRLEQLIGDSLKGGWKKTLVRCLELKT